MRGSSWRTDLDRQATIDAYTIAYRDGARALANRIEQANSAPNLPVDWQAIDFDALRRDVDSLS